MSCGLQHSDDSGWGNRMLKKPSNFVLAALRGSTYPQGVRLASSLAAAALDDFLNILGKKKVETEVEVEWGGARTLEGWRFEVGGHLTLTSTLTFFRRCGRAGRLFEHPARRT